MSLTKDTLFDNRYRLIEMKGRGSFGEVWLARDEQMNIDVAVKVFPALGSRAIEEFKEEYRQVFDFSHPNLLHANHFGICGSQPYLVMPYCPQSAASLVGRCDETTLWVFIRDVASGLAYLHSKDVVHQDIKPANVLIDNRSNFLISDFGFSPNMRSMLFESAGRDAAPAGGSSAYLAPDVFDAEVGAVKATDIWALGATLYEMTTGDLPLKGQGGYAQLNGASVGRPRVNYSKGLVDTILECMAKAPWDRPFAAELATRAQRVLQGYPYFGSLPEEPEEPKEPEKPKDPETPADHGGDSPEPPVKEVPADEPATSQTSKGNKSLLWILGIVAALGIGFGVWAFLRGDDKSDEAYFAYCKDNPTIENYRSYTQKFPDGAFVDLAQNWINAWVADSTSKADSLELVEPEPEAVKDSPKKEKDKGKDKEAKKMDNEQPVTPPAEEDKTPSEPLMPADKGLNDGGGLKPAEKKGGNGLTPAAPLESVGTSLESPNEPAKGNGLSAGPSGNTEQDAYNEIEQKINSHTATIGDCKKYLRKWFKTSNGGNAEHWKVVASNFKVLYVKMIQRCSTVAEIDDILEKHDALMMELHLAGMTEYDNHPKQLAIAKRKTLEKN